MVLIVGDLLELFFGLLLHVYVQTKAVLPHVQVQTKMVLVEVTEPLDVLLLYLKNRWLFDIRVAVVPITL